MLTRARTTIGLALVTLLLGTVPAIAAGPPVDCGPNGQWDGRRCTITAMPAERWSTPLRAR